MELTLNIDRTPHQGKPTGAEIGAIRNRLARGTETISFEDFQNVIQTGGSFTPAAMGGTSGDSWQSQQIIVADIDNETEPTDENGHKLRDDSGKVIKRPLAEPMTPEAAYTLLTNHEIIPAVMYYTFRNTADLPKFRIVVILEDPGTDKDKITGYTSKMTALLNEAAPGCADSTMADPARLIFGGRENSIFFCCEVPTPVKCFEALPDPRQDEPKTAPAAPAEIRTERPATTGTRNYSDLLAMRQNDINNFDLERYITGRYNLRKVSHGKTTYYNPCPICGHKDDFVVNGNLWHCFGANGDRGGNIIDFLKIADGLTSQEAFLRFNDIMGYDPIEWKRAYKATREDEKRIEDGYRSHSANMAAADPAPARSEAPAPAEPQTLEDYQRLSARFKISELWESIKATPPAISTGFYTLDEKLDGGLYPGLYIMGAISSLGKTTLMNQLAENVAKQGHDVLYYSLEMSRNELIAKSLSRITYEMGGDQLGKTTRAILTGRKPYNDQEEENYSQAVTRYKEYAGHIYIFEGVGDIGIKQILKDVERHKAITGNTPIIFIDYLQILAPYNERFTDKQNTDKTTLELKRLSRAYNTAVFCISSFNRESYKTLRGKPINGGHVSMTDFKESGALEYSADVLLGLEFTTDQDSRYNTTDGKYNEAELKRQDPRELSLVVLKDRNGQAWQKVDFAYRPMFNHFAEAETQKGTFDFSNVPEPAQLTEIEDDDMEIPF